MRWKMRMACGVVLAIPIIFLSVASFAHPLYLFGTIGRFPVLVMIERNGSGLSGWYFYMRQAKEIRLDGKIDASGAFALEEFDPNTGRKTAHFLGTMTKADWKGSWQSASGGAPLSFAFHAGAEPQALDGTYRCSTRTTDKPSGYTFSAGVDLGITHGKITRFTMDHDAQGHGDEQSCSVDLKSLHQRPSDAGIMLHSAPGHGDIDQQCSVRIVGNDSYLYVQVGDASETNNDCKGDAEEMFCSARGSWSDLVIDRKDGKCRATE